MGLSLLTESIDVMSSVALVVGAVVGTSFGTVTLVALSLAAIRKWIQGPTKGTDNPKRMDNRVVVITGELLIRQENLGFSNNHLPF